MTAPKKIVFAMTGLGVGGAEWQVVALARGFQALGSTIVVVTLIEPGPLKEELTRMNIPVFSLGMRRGIPGPTALGRLAKIVRREKPDVVHAHMFHANIVARLSRLLWRNIPLVCTIHNVNEVSSRSTKWNEKTWRDDAYRLTNFLSGKTTAVCDTAVRRYVEVGAFTPHQLIGVPNAIEVSKFARDAEAGARLRKELGLEKKLIGVMVARMEPPKDQELLVRAWAVAAKKHPDLYLLLLGHGPDRPKLETLMQSLGVNDRVRFMGVRKDVNVFLSMADFFLLVSNMEGMPLSTLEACAASLPLIGSRAGGVPEVILNAKTGFLVPTGDLNALVEAIDKMASLTPADRAAMGAAAHQLVSSRHDFEVVIKRYMSVYEDAIKSLRN
jgi:glycosyltransferase involved in cell wall biosynthesis